MLDPQPTPWSPPATCELGDTIRQDIRSGQAEVFLEEPDGKLQVDSINNSESCNGQSNKYIDDAANDSDDNSKYTEKANLPAGLFKSPVASAIPKQKGNRLKIRSRSPS